MLKNSFLLLFLGTACLVSLKSAGVTPKFYRQWLGYIYHDSDLGRLDPEKKYAEFQKQVGQVFCDPKKMLLFEATFKLINLWPAPLKVSKLNLNDEDHSAFDKIEIFRSFEGFYRLFVPWGVFSATHEDAAGLELTGSPYLVLKKKRFGAVVTSFNGQILPRENLTSLQRCVTHAAWLQYQSPDVREELAARERWSEARVAWVGVAVRAGHARKPVTVVAKELEE